MANSQILENDDIAQLNYCLIYSPYNLVGSEEEIPRMGCEVSRVATLDEIRQELEELRALVNTLLTVIMEEADGIQSGAANPIPELPKIGYSM